MAPGNEFRPNYGNRILSKNLLTVMSGDGSSPWDEKGTVSFQQGGNSSAEGMFQLS